ncbi:predicted protein [Nematostella vectensis]|uniref:Uncharacterized protein n=1 Tax=Nematostella vectensis TaxID=45351 RepID=A7RGU4_NEMVE|nr:predicted protein [Nematostella vectensis]|eukprot:XP_001641294.1 predicted protein [Nematostella vectensis]
MKVICAGICKTATKSMAKALRILGYNVYDVEEQICELFDDWLDLIEHGRLPDFEAMFENVDAITDLPGNFFFEEILKASPDAKVILTVREQEAWLRSSKKQLKMVQGLFSKLWFLSLSPIYLGIRKITNGMVAALYGTINAESTWIIAKALEMHNQRVRSTVPPGQLLEYSVTEGWGPLCDFLGHATPKEKFPHENVKGEFTKRWEGVPSGEKKLGRRILLEIGVRLSVIAGGLVAGGFGLYLLYHRE